MDKVILDQEIAWRVHKLIHRAVLEAAGRLLNAVSVCAISTLTNMKAHEGSYQILRSDSAANVDLHIGDGTCDAKLMQSRPLWIGYCYHPCLFVNQLSIKRLDPSNQERP